MSKLLSAAGRIKNFLYSKRTRMCFYATAIFGALAYLYLFVNNINNNDMIACMPHGYGTGISSGRWMLHLLGTLVDRIWGTYSLPLFNGVLTLILLAFSSAILVRALEIQNTKLCFALAAITATVAPIASTMFFLFTAHYYALALLLLTLAAYLVRQGTPLRFFGALALSACSLGIYQAYLPFFAGLLLLILLGECLKAETEVKQILCSALRALALLVGSYLLYRLALQLCLAVLHTHLSDYQSIGQMGNLSLAAVPQAYLDFFLLPVKELAGFNSTFFIRCIILLLFLLCIGGLLVFWRSDWRKVLLGCLFLGLLPLCANAFTVLAPDSILYTRMCMGLTVLFYLPVLLGQSLRFSKPQYHTLAIFLVTGLLLSASVNYAWQSNGNYQLVYYANRKAENYFTTMFTRIKSLEGYEAEMEVVFIGQSIADASFSDNWLGTPFQYRGRIGAEGQLNQYSREDFIANYLGYECRSISQEELAQYATEIASLAAYPNDNSMLIVDQLVLVLLEAP